MTKEIKNFEGIDIGVKGETKIITLTGRGIESMCDSLLINELEARGYILKKESKLNHIERMELELEELSEKIDKGQEFLYKENKEPKFTDEIQRFFLKEQLQCMVGYRETLRDRIKYDLSK